MTAVSAQDFARTRICKQPGCPLDARSDSDLCDEHDRIERLKFGLVDVTAKSPIQRIRAIPDRPIEEDAVTNGRACKRIGCDRPAVYDRTGPYVGLCAEHKAEAKDSSVPPPAAKPEGHSRGHKPTPVAPEAAPPQGSEGTPEGTLVEFGERVEAARQRHAQAQGELFDATVAYADALRAALAAVEATEGA